MNLLAALLTPAVEKGGPGSGPQAGGGSKDRTNSSKEGKAANAASRRAHIAHSAAYSKTTGKVSSDPSKRQAAFHAHMTAREAHSAAASAAKSRGDSVAAKQHQELAAQHAALKDPYRKGR